MTSYVNPSTRVGGTTRVVVPERENTAVVDEAPFDDEQYVRINGEWVPVNVPPPEPDTIAPDAPDNLAASGSYVAATGSVDYELTWDAPTTNEDASPLTDLAYYVVRWRYDGGSAWTSFVSNDTSFLLTGLTPGEDVEWSVLARDTSGNDSLWASDVISGVIDVTPPDQPTPPALSSTLGTIRVTWDGLLSGSTPPPPDFSRLEVYVSTASGGPWTLVGQLAGPGSVLVTGVPLGETRWLSTVAVDTSGNESARSTAVSIVVVGVTGDDIEAGSITANDIAAGAFTASFTLTGELVAGDPTGSRVEISDAGIFGYRSDGSVRAAIPTNDEESVVLEGDLIADSLTTRDQFSMQGGNNEIAKGGQLILSDGTSSPISPPNVSSLYEKYDGGVTWYLSNTRGFHKESDADPDAYYSGIFFYNAESRYGADHYFWPVVLDVDSNQRSSWEHVDLVVLWDGAKQVVAEVGIPWTAGGPSAPPDWALRLFDYSAMNSGGTTPPTQLAQLTGFQPWAWGDALHLGRCIGAGLAQQFVTAVRTSGSSTVKVRRYNVTSSSITATGGTVNLTVSFASGEGLTGVAYGSSAAMGYPGADQTIIVVHKTYESVAFTAAGVALPQFTFPMNGSPSYVDAAGSTAGGANAFLGFRSTNFYQSDPDPRWITKYTNEHWDSGVESDTWWASSTWYDPDATGGTHETSQGPLRAIALPKRAALLVTVPPYPARPDPTTTDDVTAAKVYIGRGSTEPARAAMHYAGQTNDPNRALTLREMPSGAAPPATSDFPASAPALLTSADGISWYLQGDGASYFDGPEIVDMMSSGLLSHDGTVDVVGNTTLDGTLDVTGDTTLDGDVTAAALRIVAETENGHHYLNASTTSSAQTGILVPVWFTAPPSGKVLAMGNLFARNNSARYEVNWVLKTAANTSDTGGTLLQNPRAALSDTNSWVWLSPTCVFSGLTPGDLYCLYFNHFAPTGGTSSTNTANIFVVPQP